MLERRAWGEAYHALRRADEATPLQADDLERLATAACLIGRDAEFLRVLERQYRLHDVGRPGARSPLRVPGSRSPSCRVERPVQSNAWTSRGQRLIEDHDCAERGYLASQSPNSSCGRNTPTRRPRPQARPSPSESLRRRGPEAAARHVHGRALIDQGHVVAGLKRLDETMLAVVAGELFPIMTGLMYCSVIDTCRQVYALGRAREWTSAFSRVCDQQPEMVAFSWSCLVHRAEIMQLQGAWPDAMTEACRACERAQRAERKPPGAALYQQAEIHRLRGEFAKAEGRLSRRERTGMRAATRDSRSSAGTRTGGCGVCGDPPADERDQPIGCDAPDSCQRTSRSC